MDSGFVIFFISVVMLVIFGAGAYILHRCTADTVDRATERARKDARSGLTEARLRHPSVRSKMTHD